MSTKRSRAGEEADGGMFSPGEGGEGGGGGGGEVGEGGALDSGEYGPSGDTPSAGGEATSASMSEPFSELETRALIRLRRESDSLFQKCVRVPAHRCHV